MIKNYKLYITALAVLAIVFTAGCGRISTDENTGSGPIGLIDTTDGNPSKGAVALGTAGDFVVLSKAGISTTGTTLIVGSIGISPVAQGYFTGFLETIDGTGDFSTSGFVQAPGKLYAADYLNATPAKMTAAISDMEIAYTDAAGRTDPTATELYAGDLSGQTIPPGVYKWGTGVLINGTTTTLSGPADGIWIFQISGDLTVGNGAILNLSGGAAAQNIFWQTPGAVTIGTTAQFKGIILSATTIAMNTGAVLAGRVYSQTDITLDANAITQP